MIELVGAVGRIDEAALIAFTQRLVRVRSVYKPGDGGNESSVAAVVVDQMESFGWQPVVEEVVPGRPNVLVTIEGGSSGPSLLFEGHTDVVTEGARELWSVDPFGGEIVDGRLFGRGAADMKGGLAAMIFGVAALQRSGPFPGRVLLAALVDEEGGMLGAKQFVGSGAARGLDAAIICEPEGGEICISQKGAMRLRFDAKGHMAHGAMPEHGRNPILALAGLVSDLRKYEQELQAEFGEHPYLGRPYLTATALQGGSEFQLNVLPASAWLAVDVRTVPLLDHTALRDRLADLAAKAGNEVGVEVRLSVVDDRPPTEIPEGSPVVQALCTAHRRVTGQEPRFGGVPGTTDGTILVRDAGIPVVVYGPGGKWIAHQADEYVEVDELVSAAYVYAEAASLFLRGTADLPQRGALS